MDRIGFVDLFLFGMDGRGGFFRFIFFKRIRKVACKFFDSFLREEIVDSLLRRINLFPSFNFHCKKKKKFKRRSYFSDREGKENFFSCSNLKYEVLQVCFEIKKKNVSSIGTLEPLYTLTNYNSSGKCISPYE